MRSWTERLAGSADRRIARTGGAAARVPRFVFHPSLSGFLPIRLAFHGTVSGGRRSTRITALGVVNAAGALLPTTERGTTNAVITDTATRAPGMGLTLVVPA